ncbi:MAG: sortase [Acidimicrobiia bacterium]|nr:sortase [Acidimicrobiia bacterium]
MTTTLDRPDTEIPEEEPAARPTPQRAKSKTVWRVVVWAGWTLICLGLVLLLFVVYLLWGTRAETARAQAEMRKQFEAQAAEFMDEVAALESEQGRQALLDTLYAERDAAATTGAPIARITIPKLGLNAMVVAGTDTEALKRGPGNMLVTAPPGTPGNSVVSAHRVTYGADFNRLDELVPGDRIVIETMAGKTVYRVHSNTDPIRVTVPGAAGDQTVDLFGSQVVAHDSLESKESAARTFTSQGGPSRLTLTTCNPKFSARERLIVVADMESGPFLGMEGRK